MTRNTPEMFNVYKRLDTWNPLTAALTVNGILTDEAFKERDNRQEVHKVFNASLLAFKNGELPCFKEDDQMMSLTPYKRQFLSDFYRDDDAYDYGYVKCFKPISYVKWMTDARIVKIPFELRLTDTKDGWADPPDPPTFKWNNIPLWKEAYQDKIREYLQYEYWNRIEAISMLFRYDPKNDNLEIDYHDDRKIALEALNRAIKIKTIKLDGTDEDQLPPSAFLQWACGRGYSIPIELKPLLQQSIPAIVSKDQERKEIIADKKPRCFIKQKDGWWKIIFDGESGLFRGKPFDYIAEVLKQPHGVSIDYSTLGQLVEGTYVPDSLSLNDELNIESFGRKHSVEELKNMREALETVYQLYLKNPEEHIDSWSTAKATAEKDYGILTKDDDGDLSFSESRWQNETNPDFEKARKTVSANKTRFLKKIQTVKLLSEHFNAYLKTEFGLVYDPPENSPSWEIINE